MGGNGGSGSTYYHDVWRSTDNGSTWTDVNAAADWSARDYFGAVPTKDGNITVLGGYTGSAYLNDVWQLNPSGSQSASPVHTYTNPGVYSVALQAWNPAGFNNTIKYSDITVYGIPIASFTKQNTAGYGQSLVSFTSTGTNITAWNWSFNNVTGNNTVIYWSTLQNPTIKVGPGNWSFAVNMSNVAAYNISAPSVWVNVSAVSAAFSGTPLSGTSPLITTFTDASTGLPSVFSWFFGDETYSQLWANIAGSPGWVARDGHGTAVMPDGSIILVGGFDGVNWYNDTWRSTDGGVIWTRLSASNGLPITTDFGMVAMPDGSIVLTGGMTDSITLNYGVYRSLDMGTTFTKQNVTPVGWSGEYAPWTVLMPDGSIVFMGGASTSTGPDYNSTWRSTDDGATWVLQNASSGWSARRSFQAVSLSDGNIILMGGKSGTLGSDNNETWRSTNYGATWTEVNVSSGWADRYDFTAVAMPDNSIVLMGGTSIDLGTNLNDTWRSVNEGATWTLLNATPAWGARGTLTSNVLPDGSIVIFGGSKSQTPGTFLNTTWRMQPVGSNLQNPTHTYTNTGGSPVQYSVSETVFNPASGSNTLIKSNYIAQDSSTVVASFTQNVTQGYAPLTVSFYDTSAYGISRFWNFGDGTNSTAQNPIHTYSSVGYYTVTLTETNAYGSATTSAPSLINVVSPYIVSAQFSASLQSATLGKTIGFTDLSSGTPTTWLWDFGDTITSTSQNPTHTYTAAGTYTISLTASNAVSSNTSTRPGYITITSLGAPGTGFYTSTPVVTLGTGIGFVDSTSGISKSWYWNFGDGVTSTIQNPYHVYSGWGYYNVNHSATNANGTVWNNKTNYITVNPLSPVIAVSFTGTPVSGTTVLSVQFNDTSVAMPYPVTAWSWNFGDGSTSTIQNATHSYSIPGTYSVTLTASNTYTSNTTTSIGYISAVAPLPSTGFVKWINNNATYISIDINRYNYGALSLINPDTGLPISVSQTLTNQPDSTTLDVIPIQTVIGFTGDDGSYWMYRSA
jgi:PKD repeat protein